MRQQRSRSAADAIPKPDHSVDAGEMQIAVSPTAVLETTGLGSGLGIAVLDTERGIGGLLHAVLPEAALDPSRARECPALFVDAGLEQLVATLKEQGAEDLRAYLGGAADARGCDGGAASLGCRNLKKAREVLARLGVPVQDSGTGGTRMVSLRMQVRDANVTLLDAARREVRP